MAESAAELKGPDLTQSVELSAIADGDMLLGHAHGELRLLHFFDLFFMAFIIRAGVQILAVHPRLYWKRDCTPGTEWFRFQKPVPTGRIWTAKDDAVTLPAWLRRAPPVADTP